MSKGVLQGTLIPLLGFFRSFCCVFLNADVLDVSVKFSSVFALAIVADSVLLTSPLMFFEKARLA